MDRGMESGSGIISSLQGVGSGSSRSLSPCKAAPCTWLILYYMWPVKSVSPGSESKCTYQTICEDLKLTLSIEVLLFKDTCKNESTLKQDNPISRLTPQICNSVPRSVGDIMDRFESVVQFVHREDVFSSEADLFQISLQSKVQHRENGLDGSSI